MKSYWTQGHSDKESRRKEVKAYTKAFDDLREVLEQHYKKREVVRDYDKPNWEYRQIAVNERNAFIDEILELIDLKDK